MAATILIVEDDYALRQALSDTLQMAGFQCLAAADGSAALKQLALTPVDLVVSDVQMQPMDGISLLTELASQYPELPVLLMTAYATVQQAVDAMRIGATDYLVKPFEADVLVQKASECVVARTPQSSEMIVADPASQELLALAKKVAASEATVMIAGPSGAGKEVLARYLHAHSLRAEAPFVAINCAAIPENMLEAMLFGYEKGAFTGAYKTTEGKFEQANGGTLLLDEISEMDMALQAKLLRVLQEREVERLGGKQTIALDVRVLATSNRNMREQVAEGAFREDLYYRLNVFPLELKALARRPADILPLAEYLLAKHAARAGRTTPTLDSSARTALCSYGWPGNVRELDNVIQRALILCTDAAIGRDDLHFEAASMDLADDAAGVTDAVASGLGGDIKSYERDLILDALRKAAGSKKDAAQQLGISPRTLRYKMQKLREAGMSV